MPEPSADLIDLPVSKTRLKQAMTSLQELGVELVELRDDQLTRIPLPEGLRDAIGAARRIRSREGRRRQLQYIGRLMRDTDAEPIRDALATITAPVREAVRAQQLAERWRERLLTEDVALAELASRHNAAIDDELKTRIGDTARLARSSTSPGLRGRYARELFRLLRGVFDVTAK